MATDGKQTCEVEVLKDSQAVDALVEGIVTRDHPGHERLCRAAVIDVSQRNLADEPAAANASPEGHTPVTTTSAETVVFDPELALERCGGSQDMVREMIRCFVIDVDNLFPQMRAALGTRNLAEVGRLGHRMKGTVVYLAAQSAEDAAMRVERFCKSSGGAPSDADQAVNALEYECIVLIAALSQHPRAADAKQSD